MICRSLGLPERKTGIFIYQEIASSILNGSGMLHSSEFIDKENYKHMKNKMRVWTYIRIFATISLFLGTVYV